MAGKHLLAIDQGTTGSTAIVVTLDGETLGKKTVEFPQIFPKPGWVEHDPKMGGSHIGAIGITNQRETTLVWDRKTGKPVFNAIVWQCRRTADECDRLKAKGASRQLP